MPTFYRHELNAWEKQFKTRLPERYKDLVTSGNYYLGSLRFTFLRKQGDFIVFASDEEGDYGFYVGKKRRQPCAVHLLTDNGSEKIAGTFEKWLELTVENNLRKKSNYAFAV